MNEHEDRNETIQVIREALKQRSGKPWSVTGGRGTAWGWIYINAPPSRRTYRCREKAGAVYCHKWSDQYEEYDCGEPGHAMSTAEVEELARLLNIEVGQASGGVSVPASYEYRREYIARARGETPPVIAEPYWD